MISKTINYIKKKKSSKKVLVIGEIFEDIFAEVNIVKISQEAPVMVINPKKEDQKKYLGGAGNVLQNLISAKINAKLISLAEKDSFNFLNKKIQKKLLLTIDKSYKNIKKIRYVSNNKHLIRVDHEKTYQLPKKKEKSLYKSIINNIKNIDFVVFSDYDKGFLTNNNIPKILQIIKAKKNIKVFVDSKRKNLEIYKDVYLIKINNTEACDYFKINNVYDSLNYKKIFTFLKQNKIENLIVTTGKYGAILFKKNNFYYLQNKYKKEVYDVSGAGDTFLSYLVVGHIFNLNIKESISLSNHASLLAISRYGISSISKKDL